MLRICKGSAFQTFENLVQVPMGSMRNWVGILSRGELQECLTCGACKELVEHVLFECSSYDSQRRIFWTT